MVTLNLNHCSDLNDELLAPLNLASLENLNVSHAQINDRSFSAMLANASNLKTLRCKFLKSLSDDWLNTSSLSVLEVLDAGLSNMSVRSLCSILAHSPNLKILDLQSYHPCSLNRPLDAAFLPLLEELNISSMAGGAQFVGDILASSPNLKTLIMGSNSALPEKIISTLFFPSLETLELRGQYEADSLGKLLGRMPKLKKINLKGRQIIGDLTEIPSLVFLEQIDWGLSNIMISSTSVKNLLGNAPRLKELDLTKCVVLIDGAYSDIQTTSFKLDSLGKLRLGRCELHKTLYARLIAGAPCLRELEVDSIDLFYMLANIPSLEKMTVQNAELTGTDLAKLFNTNPSLQELVLFKCKLTEDYLPEPLT